MLLAGLLLGPWRATAAELVADISDHLVAVTTGFVGTSLLLFGTVDGAGDVVVVTRGPEHVRTIRRKDRVAGIWMNSAQAEFSGVPAYYAVAASRPLDEIVSATEMERHQVGIERLRLEAPADLPPADAARFRDALIRLKAGEGLYGTQTGAVRFLGTQLFRTDIAFPANVPTGVYSVAVYLVRDGVVVSAQTTPLIVSKVGIGATIADFANEEAAAYGIVAIIVALAGGWLAGLAFSRT